MIEAVFGITSFYTAHSSPRVQGLPVPDVLGSMKNYLLWIYPFYVGNGCLPPPFLLAWFCATLHLKDKINRFGLFTLYVIVILTDYVIC